MLHDDALVLCVMVKDACWEDSRGLEHVQSGMFTVLGVKWEERVVGDMAERGQRHHDA